MGSKKVTGKKTLDGSAKGLTEPSAPRIPKGWKVVLRGDKVRESDLWWDDGQGELNWNATWCSGKVVGVDAVDLPYIRRIKTGGPTRMALLKRAKGGSV